MDTSKHCRSYTLGKQLCADGFPVSSVCMGHTCHACGAHPTKKPACQNEDLGAPWINDDGWPVFAASNQTT